MTKLFALTVGGLMCLAGHPVAAALGDDGEELRRNGAISRRLWAPEATTTELAGMRVSAGLALGLRGSLRQQLGARLAPSIHFQIDRRASLSILASRRGGAVIVWQVQD